MHMGQCEYFCVVYIKLNEIIIGRWDFFLFLIKVSGAESLTNPSNLPIKNLSKYKSQKEHQTKPNRLNLT